MTRRLHPKVYVVQPDHFPIDPTLRELFVGHAAPVYEHHLADGTFVFALYPLSGALLDARLASASVRVVCPVKTY